MQHQDQDRLHVRAVQDQHDEQLEEEEERLSPSEELQNMKDLRRGELRDHKKKMKDQETKHARMVMMLDRVVDSQDNQLRHQKFEMGELQQEMKDMKVEHDEKVHKLEEDNKDLKSQVERSKVDWRASC